jgi:uroporphyrinogen decarboxylase
MSASPVTPAPVPNTALKGFRLVSFESRQAAAMTELIRKQGGDCLSAPSMKEVPLEHNTEAFLFAEKLFDGRIDVLICMTGVGTRALIQTLAPKYGQERVVKALSVPLIVARGPKPVKVLNEFGVPIAVRIGEPNTWREILSELVDHKEVGTLKGRTVAVQEYGVTNDDLIAGLKRLGANVVRVPVYRWTLPDDLKPLKDAAREALAGRLDAALFTSANQIHNVMRVAAEDGIEKDLADAFNRLVVCSIGPLCTEALVSHSITVDLEPEHSTMGAFALDIARRAPSLAAEKKARLAAGPSPAPGAGVTVPAAVPSGPDRGADAAALAASPFMKALRREPAEVTPVWLMRQAGRYMKEYRDIRKKVPFLEFCKTPDLVAQITVSAQELLGADAAIIFSDILVVVECFGMDLEYGRNEGPSIKVTLDEGKNIDDLVEKDIDQELAFVYAGIRRTRAALRKNIPLLGFCGAPFTLASYMIEGGTSKTFTQTKRFMYEDPGRWNALMGKITRGLERYLTGQVRAGVQAVQVFDSWAGCLSPEDYSRFVAPHSARVIASVRGSVPVIHFGTGNPELLAPMARAGGDAVGVDFRIGLDEGWRRIGHDRAVQGNLDPVVLYADKTVIRERTLDVLKRAAGRPGHIFNLGHGILPETPVDHAKYLVDLVHEQTRR